MSTDAKFGIRTQLRFFSGCNKNVPALSCRSRGLFSRLCQLSHPVWACRVESLSIYSQHPQILQKSSSHLKIPGARRVTRSVFHADVPQTLGIAVQHLFLGLPGTRGFCTPEVCFQSSGVPRNFVRGRGSSTNSVEDRGPRERGSGGGSPLVRGSGGSCNLVQEISFHIVKFS